MSVYVDDGDSQTFHVFPSYHPVFYRSGQKRGSEISPTGRKIGVEYRTGKTSTKNSFGLAMTDALMAEHRDKWELVEDMRQLIIKRLLAGVYDEDKAA